MSGREPDADFHWQSFFQDAAEPVFLLSRRRRLLFVNRAWETLTGWSAAQVSGLFCSRRSSTAAGPMGSLARALCPPSGVLQGRSVRTRRPVPDGSSRFWDLSYSPLEGPDGILGFLGRIQAVTHGAESPALSPKLVALRERMIQRYRFDLLPNSLPADRRVTEQARLASRSRVGVLLVGEPGCGKQWLARAIHYEGPTRDRAFVALDCRRLPASVMAELAFGDHGLVSRAEVGTLFLKDLSALPRDLQQQFAELFIESSGGGPGLIGSTSSDPTEEVRAGRLLEELYSALGTLTLTVPPLRERRASLRELAARLLERAGTRDESPIPEITDEAWNLIEAHTWPNNLRELYAVLAAARQRAAGANLDASHLPAGFRQTVRLKQTAGRDETLPRPLDQLLEEVERRLILLALQRHKGNKSRAAKWLGIWRPRLLRRMAALGIPD